MKFDIKILLSILVVLSILIGGCQKDVDQFIPIENDTYVTNIFGNVVDQNDEPASGALVRFNDQITSTDEYGTYHFRDVLVDSRYNHLNVEKEGFFIHTRTFRGKESEMIVLKSTLLPASYNHKILSNEPATVIDGAVRIEFDGKGMTTQTTNEIYEGEVEVAIQFLDPLDENIGSIMPGDLSAVNTQNRLRILESFGMVGVALKSKDGRSLQLAEGSSAILTIEIPEELRSSAPEQIPLWHFDHESGLWLEEGSAVKDGNQYRGEVSHFSFWNFDVARDPVMLSGRMVDKNGIGLASMEVKLIRGNDSRGASGVTDYEGYFSGPAEKGASLTLTVTSKCNGEEVIYEQTVGPFENDTDLGTLVLDVPDIEYLTIRGDFLSCEGGVMNDGLLKLNDQGRPDYFPILGGTLDKTFGVCGLESIELEILDRQSLQKSSLGDFNVPGIAEIGELKVCDAPVNFVSITSSTLDFNLVLLDSVTFWTVQWSKTLLSFDYSYEKAVFEIKYVDQVEHLIEEGSHKILKMVCNWRPDASTDEIVLVLKEGDIDIEEVNNTDGHVKGSFQFEARIAGTTEFHQFEGTFFSNFK